MFSAHRLWLFAFCLYMFSSFIQYVLCANTLEVIPSVLAWGIICSMTHWFAYRHTGTGWLVVLLLFWLPFDLHQLWCHQFHPFSLVNRALFSIMPICFWIASFWLYRHNAAIEDARLDEQMTFSASQRRHRQGWLVTLWIWAIITTLVMACASGLFRQFWTLSSWIVLGRLFGVSVLTALAYRKRGVFMLALYAYGWPIGILCRVIWWASVDKLSIPGDIAWHDWIIMLTEAPYWAYSLTLFQINNAWKKAKLAPAQRFDEQLDQKAQGMTLQSPS